MKDTLEGLQLIWMAEERITSLEDKSMQSEEERKKNEEKLTA
jgi:hypothetical protein